MRTNDYMWSTVFKQVYDAACARYEQGKRGVEVVNEEETAFLLSIGCRAYEFYDFIEDFYKYGEPDFGTALLVAAARRDYFLYVQDGIWVTERLPMSGLPAKTEELAGFRWLPRIIEKAKMKLRGQMEDDLMYCCGGDRDFLKSVNIHPADFLRYVWSAGDNRDKIVQWVAKCSSKA